MKLAKYAECFSVLEEKLGSDGLKALTLLLDMKVNNEVNSIRLKLGMELLDEDGGSSKEDN